MATQSERLASEAVMYSLGAQRQEVIEPDQPLWPGTYMRSSSDPNIWRPMKVEEWEMLPPLDRLDVFLAQMHQIVTARDQRGEILVQPWPGQIEAAFGIRDLRRNLQVAICNAYHVITENEPELALTLLSSELLLSIFRAIYGVDLPLHGAAEGITALVCAYGKRYCEEGKTE